ncbi:MAG: hypothetical protein IT507_17870 [Burkholderiaceae bacterium]|nr:hypothetical protein [Burkholderiaceae bacterium]
MVAALALAGAGHNALAAWADDQAIELVAGFQPGDGAECQDHQPIDAIGIFPAFLRIALA